MLGLTSLSELLALHLLVLSIEILIHTTSVVIIVHSSLALLLTEVMSMATSSIKEWGLLLKAWVLGLARMGGTEAVVEDSLLG